MDQLKDSEKEKLLILKKKGLLVSKMKIS